MISKAYAGVPPHGRNQRIGLFGGSFNPPHEGHRSASLMALRRLRLDEVWWLVSPGNPLKDTRDLPSMEARMDAARRVASHPRIVVTGFEQEIGARYTCDTVVALRRRCPMARFVWLMGADSFADLPRWRRWRTIIETMPLGIVDRPGSTLTALRTPTAGALERFRLKEEEAALLADIKPPVFVFLHGKRSAQSSTAIRARRAGSVQLLDSATTSA